MPCLFTTHKGPSPSHPPLAPHWQGFLRKWKEYLKAKNYFSKRSNS